MSYRPGDVDTALGPLRFTLSALAEITETLRAPDVQNLSARLRDFRPDAARSLLTALLRPSGNASAVAGLSDKTVAAHLGSVSACILGALTDPRGPTPTPVRTSPITNRESGSSPWPFEAWHRLAVTRLGLAPSEFWDMPLADWLSLITPQPKGALRADLDQLMKAFPDDR